MLEEGFHGIFGEWGDVRDVVVGCLRTLVTWSYDSILQFESLPCSKS